MIVCTQGTFPRKYKQRRGRLGGLFSYKKLGFFQRPPLSADELATISLLDESLLAFTGAESSWASSGGGHVLPCIMNVNATPCNPVQRVRHDVTPQTVPRQVGYLDVNDFFWRGKRSQLLRERRKTKLRFPFTMLREKAISIGKRMGEKKREREIA